MDTPLNLSRAYHGTVFMNDKIYLFGGYEKENAHSAGEYCRELFSFDPKSKKWVNLSTMVCTFINTNCLYLGSYQFFSFLVGKTLLRELRTFRWLHLCDWWFRRTNTPQLGRDVQSSFRRMEPDGSYEHGKYKKFAIVNRI